jgi:hypothetical protein
MARQSRRPVDWTFSKCKAFASWVVLPVGAKGNFREILCFSMPSPTRRSSKPRSEFPGVAPETWQERGVHGSACGYSLEPVEKVSGDPVFAEKAGWRGATKEHTPKGSVTEEQRSQPAFSAKTLRAAVLLGVLFVGSAVTARCGDAPASPPRSRPKSLAAGPHSLFRRALRRDTWPACQTQRGDTALRIRILGCLDVLLTETTTPPLRSPSTPAIPTRGRPR